MNAEQNNTVSLPQLIQLLAELTGIDAAESRKFLHEFFALIEETLTQGQNVKIKGIGSFAVEDRENGLVRFTPDADLAAAVNTPFAMFEPMELGEGISPEDLAEEDITEKASEPEPEPTSEDKKEEYVVAIDTPMGNEPDEPQTVVEETEPEIKEAEPEAAAESESTSEEEPSAPEESEETDAQQTAVEADTADDTTEIPYVDPAPKRRVKEYVLIAVVAIAIGFAIGFYTHKTIYHSYTVEAAAIDSLEKVEAELPDSIVVAESPVKAEEQPVEEKPVEIVRDTIRSNNFLASMARRHYGHMEYWVYIYEANPGLGHPDRIKPGTVVIIPSRDEFAQGSDSATMAKALRMYADIYNRYK